MTKLATYLKESGKRQKDFAAEIGYSQAAVSKFASGAIEVSLAFASKVQEATDGSVRLTDWPNLKPLIGAASTKSLNEATQ